ncbi:helix-turn-helix transcriptional regulator [Paenibacillus solisilvae]|uniref:Helix-turn-helix transcriptional regulator n=1 Tax=Paenibacillus solisilvae TaxID=2486751 RepID=A0ABW0W3D7_9BACL
MDNQEEMSTRKNILFMIKTQGSLSATQITNQMDITNMAIRRHLNTLEKEGLIESKTMRQAMGRPTAVYSLTDAAEDLFPKKYHTLTLDLLNELVDEAGPNMVEVLFKRRKDTLHKKYKGEIQGKNLEEKVALLAGIQNENGYIVKWEKSGEDGPEEYVLTEHNCPISQIANQYDHACTCELELFESLLDADVKRTNCLAKGDQKCVYKIKARAKERSSS